jgi:DNA-binding MarR family transcriptional regulator
MSNDDTSTVEEPVTPGTPPPSGTHPDEALLRLAEVVIRLADHIQRVLTPMWDPLTGLQVLFLTTIARGGRVTRTDLQRDCRTSRAALTPGLSSLIHHGYVRETPDGAECLLTLGPAGRDLMARIDRAHVAWTRHALTTHPYLDPHTVQGLIRNLERLTT